MSVGTKIRKLRIQNKLSQPELASKLNISQTALSEIERGKTKKVDFLLMGKVCNVFGVNFDYFLEDKKVFKIKTPIKEPKNIYTSKFSFEIKA